jgi:hypothetical protein
MFNATTDFGKVNLVRMVLVSSFIMALAFLQSGCSMDGVRHLIVVDENGQQLKGILIIPLYSRSFGIGVGPDGKGYHTKQQLMITKPFVFDSGDDLMSKKISTKGVILPPFVFIGRSNYVDNWLFVKKEFSPKLVQSVDIYGEAPIVMVKSSGTDNTKLIDVLLAPKHDQSIMRKQFGVEEIRHEITVVFDEKDFALLEKYR